MGQVGHRLELRYLPTIDPVVGRDPGAGSRQPMASYLNTRSAAQLDAELCLVVVPAASGTKAASRGSILLVNSSSPRPMPREEVPPVILALEEHLLEAPALFVLSVVLAWRGMAVSSTSVRAGHMST